MSGQIDSKLRGCDVVSLKVEDIAPHGYAMERASARQKKTGRPVRFEFTDQARQSVDEYLRLTQRQPGSFLFGGRRGKERSLTTLFSRVEDLIEGKQLLIVPSGPLTQLPFQVLVA